MPTIRKLKGIEILDSRGRPTVKAVCMLDDGTVASASVPSGLSTGAAEAHELRDGDPTRYAGLGCRRAAANVSHQLDDGLKNRPFETQGDLDRAMLELDGTPQKSRLGANALLAVSVAFARAHAARRNVPLYQHFADMLGEPIRRFPRMTLNLFSGGKHGGEQVPIQDVLMVPASADTFDEGLVAASRVYHQAVRLIRRKYKMRWLTADEGGLAPPAASVDELIQLALQAISEADLEPGKDVCLALDVASTHFHRNGRYELGATPLSSDRMIERLGEWIDRYPIVSLEDGLAEDDWERWPQLLKKTGDRVLVLGDDLLCTNVDRITKAIELEACNALLLKVNQVGTLTESLDALRRARSAGWHVTTSVRSGDTEDDWFSDLAIGWSADQTKAGSLTQSERLSKYNRLLEIENQLHLPMIRWPQPA